MKPFAVAEPDPDRKGKYRVMMGNIVWSIHQTEAEAKAVAARECLKDKAEDLVRLGIERQLDDLVEELVKTGLNEDTAREVIRDTVESILED